MKFKVNESYVPCEELMELIFSGECKKIGAYWDNKCLLTLEVEHEEAIELYEFQRDYPGALLMCIKATLKSKSRDVIVDAYCDDGEVSK